MSLKTLDIQIQNQVRDKTEAWRVREEHQASLKLSKKAPLEIKWSIFVVVNKPAFPVHWAES